MLPVLLALACYVLALLQRPGLAVSDTKIDLHVDPVRFLADAAAPWSGDISLGHVQSGQYGGYLFPIGPFHAALRELGLAPWVVERLWLGTLYALAAWGVVKLVDALYRRDRGVAHLVAAGAFVLNPYVVTYTSRVSVSLLAYAALPWLLLFVHRGVREPRSWIWPAAFALVVTSSGGGINAAVTAWVLLGPLALMLYEPALGIVAWRAVRGFAWRTAVLGAVTSLWWVVPLLVQSKWGLPFLPYTEQPGTIWQTTSATESLRLMGFWLSYVGIGYGGRLVPYTADAGAMVFLAPVLLATLLVPALALGGFAWTRRWRYGPFCLGLALVGVLVMTAGFPEGTPLRSAMTFAYNQLVSLQFLRTTYKAGPLAALGLALLAGVAAAQAWAVLRARRPVAWRATFAAAAVALLALSAWPLVRGRGVDEKLTFERVPEAWRAAAADVDRSLGPDRRAMVLPGQLFSAYTWGTTVDPILPTLARRPVAVRQVVPFADLRSVELQWATDALVSQRRGVPGQLAALLGLLAVGQVVTGADDDRALSGALGANAAARELERQGLATPVRRYGPPRLVPPQAGDVAAPAALAQVRRYAVASPPMVRLLGRAGATIVDGSAGGILGLAAFGALPVDRALRYAADVAPAELRRQAAAGARIVISDSNRRQVFVPSRLRGNVGAVLAAGDPISADGHQLDPFPEVGTGGQTVARLDGVAHVRAPFSPQSTQFPEHRPFAAVDGDPRTAWLADRTLAAPRWYLDVGFDRPRDVAAVDLLPYSDARGVVREVAVGARRFRVRRGWNRLPVELRGVTRLRVTITDVSDPPAGVRGGAGGIAELRIPGVRAGEALRLPVLAERALRGADLSRTPLTYLFERARGDDPYHRGTVHGPWSAGEVRDQGDAERGLERLLAPPVARRWRADAWVSIAPAAPDPLLDRLAGRRGGPVLESSSRYQGQPRWRASSAFDGDPGTAWVGAWLGPGGRPAGARAGRGAFLRWTLARPVSVRRLRLVPARARLRRPTAVRLVADGRAGAVTPVAPDGRVVLARPLRGRRFTLEIVRARFAAGTPGPARQRRAVAVAELRGPGIPRVAVPRRGSLRAGCAVTLLAGGARWRLRPRGRVADLDAGRPLRAGPCGAPAALAAGAQRLSVPGDGPFRVDLLRLDSPARVPLARSGLPAGRILDAGEPGRGRRTDIGLQVARPAWLVLGESYSTGWRASCDGRSLGPPVPLNGYSAAWPVQPGCRSIDVVFAGNRLTGVANLISLVAALVLLVLVALGLVRRRVWAGAGAARAPAAGGPAPALPAGECAPMALRRALAWGLAAALAGGFVYALRAGVVIGPLVTLVLWRGVGAGRLALAAGALLAVVVPALYLLFPAQDKGGFNANAPIERIGAHWVGVAALVLLWLALYRALAAAGALRRARRPSATTPPAAAH